MKSTKFQLAIVFCLSFATPGWCAGTSPWEAKIPQVLKAYFSAEDFSQCLGHAFAENFNAVTLRDRLLAIDARRDQLATQSDAQSCDIVVRQLLAYLRLEFAYGYIPFRQSTGCGALHKIEKSLTYHSQALFSCEKAPDHRTENSFYLLTLYWAYHENKDLGRDANQTPDMVTAVEKFALSPEHPSASLVLDSTGCLLSRIDPLVRWLLAQPYRSVSHWQLYERALTLYSDPFLALALIGQMFDDERQHCPSRSRACVLANKMRPLYSSDQTRYINPVGDNYHFWAQLNASLTEPIYQENAANWLIEWASFVKQSDNGHYSANALGIEIGWKSVQKARETYATRSPDRPVWPGCRL